MSKKISFRTAYSGHVSVKHPEPTEPSRVKQEFKKEVNINTIVERMRRGIQPPPWMTSATPRYGDFSNMPTNFMDAFAMVERAEEAFMSLPLEFRRELDHDPRNLDKAPRELYERYGLLKAKDADPAGPEGLASRSGVRSAEGGKGSSGDRNHPSKSHSGSNKGVKNTPAETEGEK